MMFERIWEVERRRQRERITSLKAFPREENESRQCSSGVLSGQQRTAEWTGSYPESVTPGQILIHFTPCLAAFINCAAILNLS